MFVQVKRWFHSKEVWLNIASAVTAAATLALSQLSTLGLSPGRLFFWSLALTFVVNIGNIFLRLKSNSVVGSKEQVEAVKVSQ